MTYTPIARGTTSWDVPVNAAFADQDTRITNNATAITTNATNIALLDGENFNVKTYGATGNGSTNDTTFVQAAIDAASAAGGGIVYFPHGIYSCATLNVPSFVRLIGENRGATQIQRRSAGVGINMSGPSTDASGATHVKYSGIENMTLNGNSLTGTMLQCYYNNNCVFRDILFTSSTERLVDGVEFWDSRFYNCQFESSGGTNGATLPGVHLRNASSATPATFGYSLDNVNQIVFDACRWENFHNGALRIEDGSVAGNNPNTIYVTNCKMESSGLQGGEHIFVDDSSRAIWINSLYCFSGGFAGGFTTAQNIINWSPQQSVLENVLLSNGGTATVGSGVVAFSPAGQRTVLRNITSIYGTAPTGNHIFFTSSTGAWNVQNCYSGTGSQFGGTIPTDWEGDQPTILVAGVPADSSFVRTPPNGTLAVNTSANTLYARIAGVWTLIT